MKDQEQTKEKIKIVREKFKKSLKIKHKSLNKTGLKRKSSISKNKKL